MVKIAMPDSAGPVTEGDNPLSRGAEERGGRQAELTALPIARAT